MKQHGRLVGVALGVALGSLGLCGFVCLLVLLPRLSAIGAGAPPPARTSAPPPARTSAPATPAGNVIVNEVRLSDGQLRALKERYNLSIDDGNYWYDPISGAWGLKGGPTASFTAPNLEVGGALRADASGGGTRIFLNGRELHPTDVVHLQAILGRIPPGRYWLDPAGNFGLAGRPAAINIIALMHRAANSTNDYGGSPYYGSAGQNDEFYFNAGECSYMNEGGLIC